MRLMKTIQTENDWNNGMYKFYWNKLDEIEFNNFMWIRFAFDCVWSRVVQYQLEGWS